MRDIKSNVDEAQSLAPAAITSTTNGSGVDIRGYDSAMAVVHPGTRTDGTHTPKLQESDDNSTFTDVASSDLQGTFAAIASNTIQRVGYVGSKRYLRVVTTVSGATVGAVYGATIVRGNPAGAALA